MELPIQMLELQSWRQLLKSSIRLDFIFNTKILCSKFSINLKIPKFKIPSDGVFGLSFLGKTRGKKNLPSPVNSILKGAKQKLVNIWFSRAKNNAERYGTLTFGKINTDNCSATVQYSAVDNTEDFTFHVQKWVF